ncbi:MAG: hypothetical protein K2I22_00900 [Lachnospiraceae bacterium]|nr:hypothetical protein [Lachnospiraceae bacterium]
MGNITEILQGKSDYAPTAEFYAAAEYDATTEYDAATTGILQHAAEMTEFIEMADKIPMHKQSANSVRKCGLLFLVI